MFNKLARSKYNVNSLILQRWSPRAFADIPVDTASVKKLIEAARWAASSFNEQPWRFIVGIQPDETYKKIFSTLGEWNQNWAGEAPVLLMACGKKTFSKTNKNNTHYAYDVGQAMANLAIQATEDGLSIHQMAGFSPEKAISIFNIPDDFHPLTVTAIGHAGHPDTLNNELREIELETRKRKNLDEICFSGSWGNSI